MNFMKNIILIEDRINRQKKVLGSQYPVFESMVKQNHIKNIQGGKDFEEIKERFSKSEFDVLANFDIIMFHRSAFPNEIRYNLTEFLKNNKKTFVSFSGGISSVELTSNASFTSLMINVNVFYNHLLDFLKDEEKNLYRLAFGQHWKFNLLYDGLDKLHNFLIERNNEIKMPFSAFESYISSSFIKEIYFKDFKGNQIIVKDDIESVIKKIKIDLNQGV